MADQTHPIDFIVPVDDRYRDRGLATLGVVLFARTLLLIPHIFLLATYFVMVQFVVWLGYWYILIQGGKPFWVENLEIIFLEWASRVFAWFTSTTDVFPTLGTDENHPAQVTVVEAPEPQSPWLAVAGILLIRPLMALPTPLHPRVAHSRNAGRSLARLPDDPHQRQSSARAALLLRRVPPLVGAHLGLDRSPDRRVSAFHSEILTPGSSTVNP